MPIRKEVAELVRLGPMPSSDGATEESVPRYQDLLESLRNSVTDEEARELVKLFGEDDFFGLAWTLLGLIETAPSWPMTECLSGSNEWIEVMRRRVANAERQRGASTNISSREQ